MNVELPLCIVLISPPAGVDFGIQQGKGHDFQILQKQRSAGQDLRFECTVTVKDNRDDGLPNFLGQLVQGPVTGRFLYIDVGKIAGQRDSCWERRIKIPLGDIGWDLIRLATSDSGQRLAADFPGTAKDGGPSCAKVRSIAGWKCTHDL